MANNHAQEALGSTLVSLCREVGRRTVRYGETQTAFPWLSLHRFRPGSAWHYPSQGLGILVPLQGSLEWESGEAVAAVRPGQCWVPSWFSPLAAKPRAGAPGEDVLVVWFGVGAEEMQSAILGMESPDPP